MPQRNVRWNTSAALVMRIAISSSIAVLAAVSSILFCNEARIWTQFTASRTQAKPDRSSRSIVGSLHRTMIDPPDLFLLTQLQTPIADGKLLTANVALRMNSNIKAHRRSFLFSFGFDFGRECLESSGVPSCDSRSS